MKMPGTYGLQNMIMKLHVIDKQVKTVESSSKVHAVEEKKQRNQTFLVMLGINTDHEKQPHRKHARSNYVNVQSESESHKNAFSIESSTQ